VSRRAGAAVCCARCRRGAARDHDGPHVGDVVAQFVSSLQRYRDHFIGGGHDVRCRSRVADRCGVSCGFWPQTDSYQCVAPSPPA
jgi:hypothetical protein